MYELGSRLDVAVTLATLFATGFTFNTSSVQASRSVLSPHEKPVVTFGLTNATYL